MSRVTPQRTALVCLCLIFLTPSVSRAAPQARVIFGPERFERAKAAPDDQERWFVSTGLTPSPLMLDVWNGDLAVGSTRVTAAWIAIDGREVVGPSLFKKAVHAFRVGVDLAPGRSWRPMAVCTQRTRATTITRSTASRRMARSRAWPVSDRPVSAATAARRSMPG